MRRSNLAVLFLFAVVAVLVAFGQADALQSTRAYKEVSLTIVVTPSPAPVGFLRSPQTAVAEAPPDAGGLGFARAFADSQWRETAQAAGEALPLDELGAAQPALVAAAPQAQPSPVPVQFNAKADPNAAYLLVIPHLAELDAPYGTTVFPCAFEIRTYYTTAHQLTDWGYGTTSTGTGVFPVQNYPTASYLSWAVPDLAPTVQTYANSGSPGQSSWLGNAGQTQQHCIDLTLTVPNSQAAGTYTAPIQYNLIVH